MNTITKIPCGVTIEFDSTMFLKILDKYGVSGWNAWIDAIHSQNLIYPSWNKEENPPALQISFDLTGINLSNRQLDGIDLQLVDTFSAIFCHASLCGSKLLIANMGNFIGADLRTASFESCDVSRANFTEANLEGVNWHRAFYYKGIPPIGLPADKMAGLIQDMPVEGVDADTSKIICLADIKDAAYWCIDG